MTVPTEIGPDDTGCHILHVDMDAFYASVEIRDRPELMGKPVIVGSPNGRSVVLSASYEARTFGVRSAMPGAVARRLCPQAIFVPPRRGAYSEVSKQVMAVFRSVTPVVEPLALDEAFLDVSGSLRRLGSPAWIGAAIRRQIEAEQGLTCSVGVAPSKFIAKIASVRCKPDGLLVVPVDGVLEFLHPLPVSALWGVGQRTGETLARLGLRTVGDIAHAPLATLQQHLGAAVGAHLAALAWGRDSRRGDPARAGQEHRRRGDLRHRRHRARRWSGASCSGCPSGPPARCARAAGRAGRSRSSSGWPTSPPSPGPGRCPTRPT